MITVNRYEKGEETDSGLKITTIYLDIVQNTSKSVFKSASLLLNLFISLLNETTFAELSLREISRIVSANAKQNKTYQTQIFSPFLQRLVQICTY